MESLLKKGVRVCRLTTNDNPFDPFDQFDEWYAYDTGKGYHTCGLLARICKTNHDLSDEQQRLDNELAIDDVLRIDLTKNYKKIVKYL